MDRLSLINAVKRDQVAVQETYFPLDIFPERVQAIVFNLSHYENYNIEYCASIMLSAIASAIGNSYQIHIKGAWSNSPSLYMMLVGRPGLGKTPPLGFLYKPIREQDEERYYQFCDKMQEYESQSTCEGKQGDGSSSRKYPNLIKTVISDFTAEAMLNAHKNNLRGISVVVDEILGLFKSVNRYTNKGNLIELLLTSYSGQPLDYIRKSILIQWPSGPVPFRLPKQPNYFRMETYGSRREASGHRARVEGRDGEDSESAVSS